MLRLLLVELLPWLTLDNRLILQTVARVIVIVVAIVVAVTSDVTEVVKEVEAKHKTIETNTSSIAN
jgi:hypothetical protein